MGCTETVEVCCGKVEAVGMPGVDGYQLTNESYDTLNNVEKIK